MSTTATDATAGPTRIQKRVAITNAGSNLGQELAQEYAKAGDRVYLTDSDRDALINTVSRLRRKDEAIGEVFSLKTRNSCSGMLRGAEEFLGNVDVIVNNLDVRYIGNHLGKIRMATAKLNEALWISMGAEKLFKKQLMGGTLVNVTSPAGVWGSKSELQGAVEAGMAMYTLGRYKNGAAGKGQKVKLILFASERPAEGTAWVLRSVIEGMGSGFYVLMGDGTLKKVEPAVNWEMNAVRY